MLKNKYEKKKKQRQKSHVRKIMSTRWCPFGFSFSSSKNATTVTSDRYVAMLEF